MKPGVIKSNRMQEGAAAVEFAVVAALFFTVLIGVMEMGRMLWGWNAAVEATRLGARLAVVCSIGDSVIETRMRERLPDFMTANITIEYFPPSCSASTCTSVSARLSDYNHQTLIPFISLAVPLPPFQTTLPREGMSSDGNPVCK